MAPRRRIKPKDLDKIIDEDPFLINGDPVDPNQPVDKIPIGNRVCVTLPKYSRKLRMLIRDQIQSGEVQPGQFKLPDGMIMEYGKTYLVELTPLIKKYLEDGILMGGGRTR